MHHQIHHHDFFHPETVAYVSSTENLKNKKALKFIHEFDWKCHGKNAQIQINLWLLEDVRQDTIALFSILPFDRSNVVKQYFYNMMLFRRYILTTIDCVKNWIVGIKMLIELSSYQYLWQYVEFDILWIRKKQRDMSKTNLNFIMNE